MGKKSKIKILILAVVLVNVCYIFINQEITMRRIKADTTAKKASVKKLNEENVKLQDEIKMSKTDKYAEKLARERLGLIKEGETPVIDTNHK